MWMDGRGMPRFRAEEPPRLGSVLSWNRNATTGWRCSLFRTPRLWNRPQEVHHTKSPFIRPALGDSDSSLVHGVGHQSAGCPECGVPRCKFSSTSPRFPDFIHLATSDPLLHPVHRCMQHACMMGWRGAAWNDGRFPGSQNRLRLVPGWRWDSHTYGIPVITGIPSEQKWHTGDIPQLPYICRCTYKYIHSVRTLYVHT